jgi:hypothetical protein
MSSTERTFLCGIFAGSEDWHTFDLKPADFSVPENQAIFALLLDRQKEGLPTNDVVLLSDAIKENPVKWKDVDGAYLGALLDEKFQPANMGFYADIIRKDAAKRNNAQIYQQIVDLHLEPILTPGLRSLDGNARKIDGTKGTDLKTYLSRAEEETPYLIEGLFYQGVAHQFMGTIKAGKTTFLLLAVRSILHGEEFLGRVCEPTNILYVTEQPGASFRTQLRDAGVYCDNNLKDLFILDQQDFCLMDWSARVRVIRETARGNNCGLVIVDTFFRNALINEISSAGEINAAFEVIAPIVTADGRALILGWHERKAGGSIVEAASGSAAGGGAVASDSTPTRAGSMQRGGCIQPSRSPWPSK